METIQYCLTWFCTCAILKRRCREKSFQIVCLGLSFDATDLATTHAQIQYCACADKKRGVTSGEKKSVSPADGSFTQKEMYRATRAIEICRWAAYRLRTSIRRPHTLVLLLNAVVIQPILTRQPLCRFPPPHSSMRVYTSQALLRSCVANVACTSRTRCWPGDSILTMQKLSFIYLNAQSLVHSR